MTQSDFIPAEVPAQYYDYVRLFMAAMLEQISNATEFAGVPTKGARDEFERRFPIDDDWDDEC